MSEKLSIEALREVGLFRAYGDTLLAELAAACRQLELEAGEALFDYGTPGHSMYIVLSGSVQIFRHEQLIAISRPYEPVGELALIDAEPRSTSARAAPERALHAGKARGLGAAGLVDRALAPPLKLSTSAAAPRALSHSWANPSSLSRHS